MADLLKELEGCQPGWEVYLDYGTDIDGQRFRTQKRVSGVEVGGGAVTGFKVYIQAGVR